MNNIHLIMNYWQYLERLSTLVGLIGSIFAFFAWIQAKRINSNVKREKERLNQEISIELHSRDDEHIISLPFALRRRELNRSEVLGIIGMLPMKNPKERFEIRFLSTPNFRKLLSKFQDGDEEKTMIIPCSNEEIEQFEVTQLSNE